MMCEPQSQVYGAGGWRALSLSSENSSAQEKADIPSLVLLALLLAVIFLSGNNGKEGD